MGYVPWSMLKEVRIHWVIEVDLASARAVVKFLSARVKLRVSASRTFTNVCSGMPCSVEESLETLSVCLNFELHESGNCVIFLQLTHME